MGGHNHGLALFFQIYQKIRHHFGGQHIQSVGGFVKNDDIRIVDHGNHQGNLLFHTGRQVANLHLRKPVNAETFKHFFPAGILFLLGDAVKIRKEIK